MILAVLALLAATPTAEAERLGVAVARTGTLATLLPIVTAKETEELVAAHPDLSDSDKAAFRATAAEVASASREKLMRLTGHAYAMRLTTAEMRAILAFQDSPAGRAFRAAMAPAIVETLQGAGNMDFKKEAAAAFCTKTGKACPKP